MNKLPMVAIGQHKTSGGITFSYPEIVYGMEHHPLFKRFRAGDIFLSRNPMMLGNIINYMSTMFSPDRSCEFSHAGFFVSENRILESSYRVSFANFLDKYEGENVLVGRHNQMTGERFNKGYDKVKSHINRIYPYHRLALHLFNLAQFVHWTNGLVCSELVAKFLFGAELRNYKYFGVIPDHLADEVEYSLNKERTGPQYEIIFKGKLPINIYKRCLSCHSNLFTSTNHTDCPICNRTDSLRTDNLILPELINYNKSKM